MKLKKTSVIITALFLFSILIKALDCFRSANLIQRNLYVSSDTIIALVFLFLLGIRIAGKNLLPKTVSYLSSAVIGPVVLILAIVLTEINLQQGANFIFSKTYIRIDQLYVLGVFIMATGIISLPYSFVKKYYKSIIFLSGIFFLLLLYFYGLVPLSAREEIVKEGRLIENMQFVALVLASLYSIRIARKIWTKQLLLSLSFFLFAIFLLSIAGDEISWGQRFFPFLSPTLISSTNTQQELTLHNERALAGYVGYLYMTVGLYGSFAWIVIKFFKKNMGKNMKLLIPELFLFPYFFFGFLYNFAASFHLPEIGIWSEPAELMLYSGVLFYLCATHKTVLLKRKK